MVRVLRVVHIVIVLYVPVHSSSDLEVGVVVSVVGVSGVYDNMK